MFDWIKVQLRFCLTKATGIQWEFWISCIFGRLGLFTQIVITLKTGAPTKNLRFLYCGEWCVTDFTIPLDSH